MRPEDSLFDLFDDLEQQADGLRLAEREAQVGELAAGEYAEVTLVARLHGARGEEVRLRLRGGDLLHGSLARVGRDWLQLDDERGTSWLVSAAALVGFSCPGDRAVSEAALPVTARLTLRSALRALASGRRGCSVRLLDGSQLDGLIGRVGQDFVEIVDPLRHHRAEQVELVPLGALATVREQR